MGKENELINAVKEGNVQYVRKAFHKYRRSSKKPSVKKQTINLADAEGFTALHHAALLGDVEIIMAIVEMEGDTNARDKKGMTPLHMAAWAGKDAAVKVLVESRAFPNLPSLAGETPLHLAAQHGYAACAKSLLASHADGMFRNTALETPLDLACQYGHTGVVKQLLQNDAVHVSVTSPSTDPRYRSPLHLAAKSGHDDIVKLLLQSGVNINECRAEGTALHLASLYGKIDVVKLLIQAGVNVCLKNKDGYMALDVVTQFTASRAGLEIKQLLREATGERIAYARAVSDYHNVYDETCLNFKSGDSIAVLEQNEDGRWKGYVVNSENEKIGYFPAMAVHIPQSKASSCKTMSVSSMTSSSSVESTSRGVQTPNGSPERKAVNPASPASTPFGIVPIGNFEVLTLAQGEQEFNQPPKQTAAGSLPPRMSSFKQKQTPKSPIKSPRSKRAPSHKGPAPQPPVRRLSSENTPKRTIEEHTPSKALHTPRRAYSERQQHTPHINPPHRSVSNEEQQKARSMTVSAQMAGQYPGRQMTPESGNQDIRNRTRSAGSAQHDFTRALKMAIGNRVESEKQTLARQNSQNSTTSSTRNYAELNFSPGNSQVTKSPRGDDISTGNYASVYIDETDNDSNRQQTTINNIQLKNNVNINVNNHNDKQTHSPHMVNINGQHDNNTNQVRRRLLSNEIDENDQREYEDMGFRQHITSVKSTTSRSGYEDMTSTFVPEPHVNSPSPPELPVKSQPPQLPLKRSNTAPSYQRNDEKPSMYAPSQSIKSRDRSVYENQNIEIPWKRTLSSSSGGSISPRSPGRLPNAFPVFLQTPTSPDGRASPSDQRVSKTDQEVFDWLNELKLTCYFDAFKTSGFDMISIQAITPEDLSYLEIHKTGHRKKLLSEIAKLSYSERLPNHKPRDVGTWLGLLNLRQYEPNFVEGGFDDMDFIKDLDKNDLEMIDIKKRGHQKKLSLAVQRLNDLELTAILDIAVLESPIKRVPSFHSQNSQQSEPSTAFQFPTAFKRNSKEDYEGDLEEEEEMSAASARPPPPVASKPGKSPVPVPSPKPKMNGEAPLVARKPATVPGVKPKPKPAVKPPAVSPAASTISGEIQGSQEEIVQSSKSRDFFKQQEKKALDESPTNSLERRTSHSSLDRRSSHSSSGSISPTGTIIKKKPAVPPPAPKPKPSIEVEPTPASPPVLPKKVPPPAPPKRGDSIPNDTAPPSFPVFNAPPPPPPEVVEKPIATVAPQQPIEPKKPESPELCFSPPLPAFIPPPPPTESLDSPPPFEDLPPPPAEILDEAVSQHSSEETAPQQPKSDKFEDKEIEKAFGETDDILSDIMADLDDFSSQIDKMF